MHCWLHLACITAVLSLIITRWSQEHHYGLCRACWWHGLVDVVLCSLTHHLDRAAHCMLLKALSGASLPVVSLKRSRACVCRIPVQAHARDRFEETTGKEAQDSDSHHRTQTELNRWCSVVAEMNTNCYVISATTLHHLFNSVWVRWCKYLRS